MDRVSNEDYAPGACLALALMRQRQHFSFARIIDSYKEMLGLIAFIAVFKLRCHGSEGTHAVHGILPRNRSHVFRKRIAERDGTAVTISKIRDIAQSYFPESIPLFNVRRDVVTKEEVHRGNLVEKLYGLNASISIPTPTLFDDLFAMVEPSVENNPPDKWKLQSIDEVRTRLQCASNEPGLSAAFKLNELAPPSIESLEWTCAYAGIPHCTTSHHSLSLISCPPYPPSYHFHHHHSL